MLWSSCSIDSAWVRDEAAAGRDSGRLIPVLIEPVSPPMGFRQYQNLDFASWNGRGRIPQLAGLLTAIDTLGTRATEVQGEQKSAVKPAPTFHFRPIALAVGIVLALGLGLSVWQSRDRERLAPVVGVIAADASGTTAALARDLLVQLGSLQASNASALELVATGDEHEPDLIFEVSGSKEAEEPRANLALLQGRKRILLWSRTFHQPAGREADLRQQLAYAAAQILHCASGAMNAGGERLDAETQKLYFNGCADFAQSLGTDAAKVVSVFARVVENAPTFRDGWAKLLLAESNLHSAIEPISADGTAESLRRHITQARQAHPDMPEIYLAEAVLLPERSFAERLSLSDRAKQLEPDNPFVLVYRALDLSEVGRMGEAIIDVTRAVQLEPLSPAIRNAYISTLAYGGRISMAEKALDQAERLWPGTSSVRDARFRYHLRYGNPSEALELLQSGIEGIEPVHEVHKAFLEARIDPNSQNIARAVELSRAGAVKLEDFGFLGQALGEFGREEALYEELAKWKGPLPAGQAHTFFRPTLKKFRQDPRFMVVAERLGLVDYWQKSGKWPDFCLQPDLPYNCKAEAAKLS